MPYQENMGVTLAIAAESTFGTPATTGARYLRRVSSTLGLAKDAFASQEARPDFQVSGLRHGQRRGGGAVSGELSIGSWDDILAAGMRGTWASPTSITQAAYTSVASNGSGTITFGGGTITTSGLKVGDIVRFSNLPAPAAAANNVNYRVIWFPSSTTMTLFPAPPVFTAQTTFTLAVQGRKLLMGTARPSFTLEQVYPDLDVSERYRGSRVSGMQFQMQPNGNVQANFQFDCLDSEILSAGSSPHFATVTAAGTTSPLTALEGGVRLFGADRICTAFDLSVSLNTTNTPVVGSSTGVDIFYGMSVVTGNVTILLDDASLLSAFSAETVGDIALTCYADGNAPRDFINFVMNAVKFTGASKQIGTSEGVLVQCPFQAVLQNATSTADVTSLMIQRSNAS